MQQESRHFRGFFVIWGGQALSLLGSQLVQFALIWWLTETTQSATVLAMASLVGLMPQVVLGPFVGVLVDRWDRRRVMLLSDTSVALATLALGVLFWLGAAQVGHVFLILFIRALAGSFHWPALQASASLMVPEKHLTRLQGLNQALNGALNIAAAPLGALLLAVLPMQGIIVIDVGTALFAISPLLFITIPQPQRTTQGSKGVAAFWRSFRQELGDGLRYVRGWPGLILLIAFGAVINLLMHPALSLMPILVTDHFGGGALQLGWLEAAAGIGIVAGGALLSTWGGFNRRVVTTLVGVSGLGLAVTLVGLTPASVFGVAVAGLFFIGLTIAFIDGPIMAIVQAAVAPEMQGRVFTLLGSVAKLMAPLGLMIAGPAADLLGVRIWFVAAGLLALVTGVTGFFIPALLNIEEKTAAVPAGGAPLKSPAA